MRGRRTRTDDRAPFLPVLAAAAAVLTVLPVEAQEVWSGLDYYFRKLDGADPTLPANQGRITDAVWITRASTMGLFNAAQESGYTRVVSPVDTEWAYGAAVDWQSLTFQSWENWANSYPPGTLWIPAVVHLIGDDIYLDIRFESWTSIYGGGFSYSRAMPDPVSTETTTWGRIKGLYR